MAQYESWFKQDLKKPIKVQLLNGNLFSQDNQGNLIGVEVFDNGEPASLAGTVSANIIRADGGTVAATGTLSGNKCSVVLPAAAYAIPGLATIVIKLTSSGVVTTLLALVVTIYRASTDTAVDPGTVMPSIQSLIQQINTAVASIPADYSSLWTSLAPAFSTDASYAAGQYVTYNGKVYRFKTAHSGEWAAGDVREVKVGSELTDLKSVLNELDALIPTFEGIWYQGSINPSAGGNADSSTRIRTPVPIDAPVGRIRASEGYYFIIFGYDNSDTYIGVWNGTSFSKPSTFSDNNKFVELDVSKLTASKYKFILSKFSGESIIPSEGINLAYVEHTDTSLSKSNKIADSKAVGDRFYEVDARFQEMANVIVGNDTEIVLHEINGKTDLIRGIAINGSGEEIRSNTSYSTDYIDITSENNKIYSDVILTDATISHYHYINFYDSDKTYISRTGGSKKKTIETYVPSGTKYIRVSLTYTGIENTTGYTLKVFQEVAIKGSPINKWYVFGDSISAGYFSITDEEAEEKGYTISYRPAPSTGVTGVGSVWDSSLDHNYWGYANKWFLKRNLNGKAYPGQGFLRIAANDKNGIMTVQETDVSDAGLITVAWGFNDWHYNLTRGNHDLIDPSVPYPTSGYDTTQITTINQAIWFCLGELIRKAPHAKIVVQTPMNGWLYGGDFDSNWGIGHSLSQSGTLADIHDDIVYWANYYGLQVMDMTYNNSVVNRLNIKEVLLDGSHPSDPAHMQLGRTVGYKLLYG